MGIDHWNQKPQKNEGAESLVPVDIMDSKWYIPVREDKIQKLRHETGGFGQSFFTT